MEDRLPACPGHSIFACRIKDARAGSPAAESGKMPNRRKMVFVDCEQEAFGQNNAKAEYIVRFG